MSSIGLGMWYNITGKRVIKTRKTVISYNIMFLLFIKWRVFKRSINIKSYAD